MSTLLLRLAGPLQSWGGESKFSRRMTNSEPTKSGIVGMLACALGRKRAEPIEDLAALRFGVRTDQRGKMIRDFQITQWGLKTKQKPFLSHRYYLADAVFLVGIEGEDKLLAELESALRSPVFPLFLGRRSCPPAGELVLGIRAGRTLQCALHEEPWLASDWYRRQQPDTERLELVIDAQPGTEGSSTVRDLPLSFDQMHRKYGFRNVFRSLVPCPKEDAQDYHDAMKELGDVFVAHSNE